MALHEIWDVRVHAGYAGQICGGAFSGSRKGNE